MEKTGQLIISSYLDFLNSWIEILPVPNNFLVLSHKVEKSIWAFCWPNAIIFVVTDAGDLHLKHLTEGMETIIDFVPNLFLVGQKEPEVKKQVEELRKNLIRLIKQVWLFSVIKVCSYSYWYNSIIYSWMIFILLSFNNSEFNEKLKKR